MNFELLIKIEKITNANELFEFFGVDELLDTMIINHKVMDSDNLNKLFLKQDNDGKMVILKYSNKIDDLNIMEYLEKINNKKDRQLYKTIKDFLIINNKIPEGYVQNLNISKLNEDELLSLIVCSKTNEFKLDEIFDYIINNKKELKKYDDVTKYYEAFLLNNNTSVKILEELSKKSCNRIKKLVLHHKNTPSWLIQELKGSFPLLANNHENGKKTSVDALLEGIEHYRKDKN